MGRSRHRRAAAVLRRAAVAPCQGDGRMRETGLNIAPILGNALGAGIGWPGIVPSRGLLAHALRLQERKAPHAARPRRARRGGIGRWRSLRIRRGACAGSTLRRDHDSPGCPGGEAHGNRVSWHSVCFKIQH